jgi:hypothetical protein
MMGSGKGRTRRGGKREEGEGRRWKRGKGRGKGKKGGKKAKGERRDRGIRNWKGGGEESYRSENIEEISIVFGQAIA